jgi:hypothetical protein
VFGNVIGNTHQFTGSVLITGSIGIGTTSPATLLHLYNGTESNLRIESTGAGGDRASIYVQKSAGGGLVIADENRDIIFRGGTSALTGNGGTEFMRISGSNGYVGIGRTVPEFTLDVNGDIALNRTNKLMFSGPVAGDRSRSYFTGDGNNNVFLYGPSSNVIATFTYTGNVGIGVTSPASTLDVRAAIGAGQLIQLANTSGYSNSNTMDIGFAIANSNSGLANAAVIGVTNPSATGNNYGDIYFKTVFGGGSMTERLRITSAGQIKAIPNVGNYSQVFSIAGNAPNGNVDDIVLGMNVISGNPYTVVRGNTSNSAWQIFGRTAHSPAADGNSTFGIDYITLSGTQMGVIRVTGDSASPAVQFSTVGYHEVGSAGFSNTPNYGGHLDVITRIPQGTWTTFANVTNNSWAGITELNWTSVADYNRSGAAYLRWAYNGSTTGLEVVYTLFNNSQNATATFRNNSGALQINIAGGAADYYLQVRIMGSRAA